MSNGKGSTGGICELKRGFGCWEKMSVKSEHVKSWRNFSTSLSAKPQAARLRARPRLSVPRPLTALKEASFSGAARSFGGKRPSQSRGLNGKFLSKRSALRYLCSGRFRPRGPKRRHLRQHLIECGARKNSIADRTRPERETRPQIIVTSFPRSSMFATPPFPS